MSFTRNFTILAICIAAGCKGPGPAQQQQQQQLRPVAAPAPETVASHEDEEPVADVGPPSAPREVPEDLCEELTVYGFEVEEDALSVSRFCKANYADYANASEVEIVAEDGRVVAKFPLGFGGKFNNLLIGSGSVTDEQSTELGLQSDAKKWPLFSARVSRRDDCDESCPPGEWSCEAVATFEPTLAEEPHYRGRTEVHREKAGRFEVVYFSEDLGDEIEHPNSVATYVCDYIDGNKRKGPHRCPTSLSPDGTRLVFMDGCALDVVRTDKVVAYLRGGAPFWRTSADMSEPDDPAPVCQMTEWLDEDRFRVSSACCGSEAIHEFDISKRKRTRGPYVDARRQRGR